MRVGLAPPLPGRIREPGPAREPDSVVREILADLDTPLSLYRRLDDGRTSFLLESVQGGEKWARYSFIGTGARAIFRARGPEVEWSEGDHTESLRDDWVRFVEKPADENPDRSRSSGSVVRVPRDGGGLRQRAHSALIVRHVHLREGDDPAEALRAEAGPAIDRHRPALRAPLAADAGTPRAVRAPMDVQRSMTERGLPRDREARQGVHRGRRHLPGRALPAASEIPLQVEPFDDLSPPAQHQPEPYLFFVRCDGPVLVGSSPEILVRLEDGSGRRAPDRGDAPRGATPSRRPGDREGAARRPKERAEHLMLVDLGRNDVGRVAEIGIVSR